MSRIHFGPLDEGLLEWLRLLHNDPLVLKNLTDPRPVNPVDQKKWFEKYKHWGRNRYQVIFLEDDDGYSRPIGLARFAEDFENHSLCVGLDIHKDYRGKGYARKAYNLLLKESFYCYPEFTKDATQRIWLQVAEYNTVARILYSSLGFREEGRCRKALYRDGEYYDYITMSILRDEYYKLHPEDDPALQGIPTK